MAQRETEAARAPDPPWRLLLRLRWLLAGVIALAFALGQVIEALLLADSPMRLAADVLAWAALGGLGVWLSLTWVGRQERHYQTRLGEALERQQQLNADLARANGHLELLSAVNRQLAEWTGLDEILDAALTFPRRLVPAPAAALLLTDGEDTVESRSDGAPPARLAGWRAAFGIGPALARDGHLRLLTAPPGGPAGPVACLVLPLHDGVALVGWIELYLDRPITLPGDESSLLETIAAETAEVIMSARRRAREERAAYELERALTEERARIARDIHDGIAQSLAFVRLRVDLWIDWIAADPKRLRAELGELKRTLREQIGELRRAIFALRPVPFEEFGFAGGLHRYIEEFAAQQGWTVEVDVSDAPATLTPHQEAVCFRVIQESLTNIAKHAQATRAAVTLARVDGGLRIVVSDNGRGFVPGAPASVGVAQVGLRQMRERLAAIRGQLTVLSHPGGGTELRAWFPLEPAPAEGA